MLTKTCELVWSHGDHTRCVHSAAKFRAMRRKHISKFTFSGYVVCQYLAVVSWDISGFHSNSIQFMVMELWNLIHCNIIYQRKLFCKYLFLSAHLFVDNHQQQGSLHLLGGKQTNYEEVCAQQTMKMPYHIMQTEGADVILPQMNRFFWRREWGTLLCCFSIAQHKHILKSVGIIYIYIFHSIRQPYC